MKKYMFILLPVSIMILFGGIFTKYQYDKRAEDLKAAEQKFFDQAKKRMTDYINANYTGIETIRFSENYSIDPMGGINAEGYLNGNKQKEFWGIYDKSNDTITSSYVDAIEKANCSDKPCDY